MFLSPFNDAPASLLEPRANAALTFRAVDPRTGRRTPTANVLPSRTPVAATGTFQLPSCLSMKLSKAAETQRMSHRGFQSLCHIRVRTVQLPPTSL